MANIDIKVGGMHCASCAANIAINLKKTAGVKSAAVNFTSEKAAVEYDENEIKPETIRKVIKDTGYQVIDGDGAAERSAPEHSHGDLGERRLKIKVIISSILTLPLVIRMFWMWTIPGSVFGIPFTAWLQHDLAFVVVFIIGWQFHKNAFKAIKRLQTDMDTLISLGTLAAYFFSLYSMFTGGHLYFEGAASITTLIMLGRYLEFKTKDRASLAMKKLLELGVKNARVIGADGQETEKGIDDVRVGEIILVKPSEKIPLDGIVADGQSNVDEAMLSGESMPVYKEVGSNVFGATINRDGALRIKVTKNGANTVLAQIIRTVEDAQNFKAPAQRLADRISAIFVPSVVSISIMTFIGWFLISGNIEQSILSAVAVLVISCPCALGIATPIAIMVGSSVGARNGILIKNGESFERAKKIDYLLFDKTGTLTEGVPVVKEIIINDSGETFPRDKAVKIAYSLAKNSEHPLSKAVASYAGENGATAVTIDEFREVPGQGVSGRCREHRTGLLLGNRKLLAENKLDLKWPDEITERRKDSGATILFLAHGETVIAALLISDRIRSTAAEAVRQIIGMGITPVIVSGDNKHVVAAVSRELGVEHYLAEVLPNGKQAEVRKLQGQGKSVAFAGDGINDAPALVQSDLGIAMGGGTDIAKESGDIIIMKNDPVKISEAILLSKRTFAAIKQNLFWAFFYNVAAIPLAILGLVSPMIAALAMSFSDITVISNSLRIYRK